MGRRKLRSVECFGGGTGSAQRRRACHSRHFGGHRCQKATSTIPIVITAVADMLAVNLVSSLSRPGGNITGLSFFNAELTAKRLELVKEASPPLMKAAILLNPSNASNAHILKEIETTAKALNIGLEIIEAGRASDRPRAFAAMTDRQVGAIVLHEDPMLTANATALAVLAAVKRLPSCGFPEFGRAGGLLAYGINFPDMEYRAAAFVNKILKGANPAELPIERATKFNITANLQTAKALGITLPTSILLRADEVIE